MSVTARLQSLNQPCLETTTLLARFYRQSRIVQKFSTQDTIIKELSPTTSLLRNLQTGAEVYLIGTAHVSSKSADEVRALIRLVKPESVMVELCKHRLKKLRSSGQASPGFVKTLMSQLGMPGSLQGKLLGAGLSGMYQTLKAMGLEPGAEFKAGIEEADKIGATVICGDQDQHVTAQRIAQHLGLQDLLKLMTNTGWSPPPELQQSFANLSGGVEGAVEALKTRESARIMANFLRQTNPAIAKALVDERDEKLYPLQILAASLLRLKGRAVGVVGLAHLDGIERIWREKIL